MISLETGDESSPCGPNRGNNTLLFIYCALFALFALQLTDFLLNYPRPMLSSFSSELGSHHTSLSRVAVARIGQADNQSETRRLFPLP